jgi:hypothetical protein
MSVLTVQCEFCIPLSEPDAVICGEDIETPGDVFTCTRRAGHEGDHVACGISGHAIERVPQLQQKGAQ